MLGELVGSLANIFSPAEFPQLLAGIGQPDDAAVYQLDEDRAVIATADFFPPVVDDPYEFGAVAAANALSDVYAMGGDPLLALNLLCWPADQPGELLKEILRGGAEKVREAGAVLAGGHSVADQEPKFGLVVIGLAHPKKIWSKGGAQPGDELVLTKPLGSGTITTALKNGMASAAHVAACVAVMAQLNRTAMLAGRRMSGALHAATDITGFGIVGHAHEMAAQSGTSFNLRWDALPWLDGAQQYARAQIYPGGTTRNIEFYRQWLDGADGLAAWQQQLLFDPQTSGGLLMAVAPAGLAGLLHALQSSGQFYAHIGSVSAGSAGRLRLA